MARLSGGADPGRPCYPEATTFQAVGNGRAAPVFFERSELTDLYDKERSLYREVTSRVERSLPGVEVLALELSGPERMTIFVDHPQGVDHGLCERVTDVLRDYLNEYAIEVSSPGTKPPLRRRPHFERAVGSKVEVRTDAEIAGRKRFRGELVGVGERSLRVAAGSDDPVEIPYDSIVRGNLIEEGTR